MTASLQDSMSVAAGRKKKRKGKVGKPTLVKNFVLDTNVLIHDPSSLFHFQENRVWVPVDVITELDRFKNEQSERGASARRVHRILTELFAYDRRKVQEGVPTPGGGSLHIAMHDLGRGLHAHPSVVKFAEIFPDLEKPDHRILATAVVIAANSDAPTILVTKDMNMQIKAMVVGLDAQDYLTDKVAPGDVLSHELREVKVSVNELQRFASTRRLELPQERRVEISVNEYVLLKAGEGKGMPARLMANGIFSRLEIPDVVHIPKGQGIRPLNLGQQCFLDALLDPEIHLVTCYGQAGTGKTLLAVAAGLNQVYSGGYDGITISRPVVSMGQSIGFLPGALEEKMRPWLQSIYDAMEVLMPAQPLKSSQHEGKRQSKKRQGSRDHADATGPFSSVQGVKPYERLIEQGILEVEALCFIRGRSIPRRFFVLDEAQQLTPLEAKTVVTRMSRGSKLVMVGDPEQIDNPYVDSRSNGLVYTRNRLKGQRMCAHISLTKGERSDLAEAGAHLM